MHAPAIHLHRHSQASVYGQRLEADDVIRSGDLFDNIDGLWTPCDDSIIGKTVGELKGDLIIIRLSRL